MCLRKVGMICDRQKRQRGSIIVIGVVGAIALVGAGALSVDVGYFYVVRNQLQNAVDSAALAGAQGLMEQPNNFTTTGRAVILAQQYAAKNKAAGLPINLVASEITFPKGNVIKVEITRPAQTFFAKALHLSQVNIKVNSAAAIATITGGGGPGGWRPWAPMDQFGHGSFCVGPNDADVNVPPHGDFKTTAHTWKGVNVPSDRYVSPYDASVAGMDLSKESDCGNVTGYITPRDVMIDNATILLKNSSWYTPGNFGAVALGGNGANVYRGNIANGWNGILHIGDIITTEPGNMVGPTLQGVQDLIAKDPTAQLQKDNTGRWVVVSSAYPVNESPRIVPIPMYSPKEAPGNGRTTFPMRSMGAFFVHSAQNGKQVRGTFIQMLMRGGDPQKVPPAGSNSSGAGGQLLGVVTLVDPTKY